MKKIKTIIVAFILIVSGFILGACGDTAYASQDQPLKIWFQNQNGMMQTYCIVDEDTGVNYIVVSGDLYSSPIGAAITPRLNADGSLYTSE